MSKGSSPQKESTVRLYCVLLTDPVPCLGSLSNVEGVNHKREHRVVRLGTGPVDYKGSLGWQLRLPFFYTEEIWTFTAFRPVLLG